MSATLKNDLTAAVLDHDLANLPYEAASIWADRLMTCDLDEAALMASIHDIHIHALTLGMTRVGHLVDGAADLVSAITGQASIHRFTDTTTAAALHIARNTIGALAAAACLIHDEDPASALLELPTLPQRAAGKARPLADDEILVARHLAEYALIARGRRRERAITYALVEAGLQPSETTVIRPVDFDDPRTPSTIRACGAGHLATARTINLSAWNARICAIAIDRHLAYGTDQLQQRIAYSGTQPGTNKASASANGIITRVMDDANIMDNVATKKATTAGSLTAWRVVNTYKASGLESAVAISGKNGNATLRQMHWRPEPAPTKERTIRSFRAS